MEYPSLGNLPGEILLDIVDHLDTTRDVAHVKAISRHTRDFLHQDGWRAFVKAQFPSLIVPTNTSTRWDHVANRLTYLNRCWEKRGFVFTVFDEKPPPVRNNRGSNRRFQRERQSVPFHPILDVGLLSSLQDELCAWGAGEDLILRWTPECKRPGTESAWGRIRGSAFGYQAGNGDVTALSVIERQRSPEVVVGRADGALQLLCAVPKQFGQQGQALLPLDVPAAGRKLASMRNSPGQVSVSWTDWQPETQMLASCQSSMVTLYDLSRTEDAELKPIAHSDLYSTNHSDETALIQSLRFMNKDVIACGLGGTREPLRWGRIRPTGLEFFYAASNPRLVDDMSIRTETVRSGKATVRAIEPVGGAMGGNMLLSAWDDGTCRLTDLRTPSAHDAVYRSRFQPFESHSSLLAYGTSRFLAGSNDKADIRFFDFRFPNSYHHTNAMPCSGELPYPQTTRAATSTSPTRSTGSPPEDRNDCGNSSDAYNQYKHHVDKCDHQRGCVCSWHEQSTWHMNRPDATIHFGNNSFRQVFSLAKASDLSDTVYCGVRGAIVEMRALLAEDVTADDAKQTSPEGWRGGRIRDGITYMETGVSLCDVDKWPMVVSNRVPTLRYQEYQPHMRKANESVGRSRLDASLRTREELDASKESIRAPRVVPQYKHR